MLASLLLSSSLLAMPGAERHAQVWAQFAAAERTEAPPVAHGPMRPPPDRGRGEPPGPEQFGGMPPGPPWLRGVSLTEAQQDKVFEIVHGQMPALRERVRELHKSREELRAASRAERFDEAQAAALTDSIARATAAIELMRARSDAAIWQVLTRDQRHQASELRARTPHDGPPPEHGTPRPPR